MPSGVSFQSPGVSTSSVPNTNSQDKSRQVKTARNQVVILDLSSELISVSKHFFPSQLLHLTGGKVDDAARVLAGRAVHIDLEREEVKRRVQKD